MRGRLATVTRRDMTRDERSISSFIACTLAALLLVLSATPVAAQSLRGSSASLDRQNRAARQHDFTFIDTPDRVRHFANQGWLVRVRPNRNFELHAVSFPYAREEVKLFVERLAGQYRAACGEKLVVTSLTRPTTRQPRNASARSVHPTGMAIDLRYPGNRNCRAWLERVLTSLEGTGVLEATRERYPAHYHVAIYPQQYGSYVAGLSQRSAQQVQQIAYRVRTGDSLWTIARKYGTTVNAIKAENGLRGNTIFEGQVLEVPGR